jgi:hypothetical protein
MENNQVLIEWLAISCSSCGNLPEAKINDAHIGFTNQQRLRVQWRCPVCNNMVIIQIDFGYLLYRASLLSCTGGQMPELSIPEQKKSEQKSEPKLEENDRRFLHALGIEADE